MAVMAMKERSKKTLYIIYLLFWIVWFFRDNGLAIIGIPNLAFCLAAIYFRQVKRGFWWDVGMIISFLASTAGTRIFFFRELVNRDFIGRGFWLLSSGVCFILACIILYNIVKYKKNHFVYYADISEYPNKHYLNSTITPNVSPDNMPPAMNTTYLMGFGKSCTPIARLDVKMNFVFAVFVIALSTYWLSLALFIPRILY